jgi:hypothetical protein
MVCTSQNVEFGGYLVLQCCFYCDLSPASELYFNEEQASSASLMIIIRWFVASDPRRMLA